MARSQLKKDVVIARIESLDNECIDHLAQEFRLTSFNGNTRDKATKLVNDAIACPTEQGHPPLIDRLFIRAEQLLDLDRGIITRRRPRSTAVKRTSNKVDTKMRIFISHSSKNTDTAAKLVELLEAGLVIKPEEIRCTSLFGYKLQGGTHTSQKLREEINAAELIIGIITPDSVESKYVLFELGASWGLDKPTIPALAQGADFYSLPGPLKELHAIQLSELNEVNQILDDIIKLTTIERHAGRGAMISAKAQALCDVAGSASA